MTDKATARGTFTGWHMLATMVAFFGVVIAVNVTMMQLARGSFGGVVVENSYVASQHFNTWLHDAAEQDALGWSAASALQADRTVAIAVAGAPQAVAVTAMARHPLGRLPDQALVFHHEGAGRYVSTAALPAGRWTVRLQLAAGDQIWRQEVALQ
jgi:nitrogen fixation protein FixH